MADKLKRSSTAPLFEVVTPDGHAFRIWPDGRAEGFPAGSVLTNGLAPRLSLTLGLVVRARNGGRISEEEASKILDAWEQGNIGEAVNEPSTNDVLASRAGPGDYSSTVVGAGGLLEDRLHLSGTVEARLADVVHGLRTDFVAGPALHWDAICLVGELARNEFDKRVATALREGFFKFSQLLCGLEMILLQAEQFGVVREETLLGIEKLFIHANDDFVQLVGVADLDSRFPDVERGAQSADRTSDQGQVHACSPNVEKGGVGASDSTLRGSTVRGGRHG